MSVDNSSHGEIFIDLFPSQCRTTEFERNRFQLFVRGNAQAAKSGCWKAEDPAIVQFEKHLSVFDPSPHGQYFLLKLNDGFGIHCKP